MPTTKKRSSPHYKPRHKKTKKYLQPYHPFLPLLLMALVLLSLIGLRAADGSGNVLGRQVHSSNITIDRLHHYTNEQREHNSRNKFSVNEKLNTAAQKKADSMTNNNYWSHTDPRGNTSWQLIDQQNYKYSKVGENLAYGFNSSSATINGWMASPQHRANLLDEQFNEVGYGISYTDHFLNKGPAIIVVALYGQQLSAQQQTQSPQATAIATDQEVNVTYIETLSANTGSGSAIAISFIAGGLMIFLLTKYSLAIKRVIIRGEKFAIKHPFLDIAIIFFIFLAVGLLQVHGNIL